MSSTIKIRNLHLHTLPPIQLKVYSNVKWMNRIKIRAETISLLRTSNILAFDKIMCRQNLLITHTHTHTHKPKWPRNVCYVKCNESRPESQLASKPFHFLNTEFRLEPTSMELQSLGTNHISTNLMITFVEDTIWGLSW